MGAKHSMSAWHNKHNRAMNKQVQEITTDVTETGEIKLIRYDWTPDSEDFPRHADVLRDIAYDQAKDLTSALDKTLCNTIEQLHEEQDDLTGEEQSRLNEIYTTMHRAYTALKDTISGLWEWQYDLNRTRDSAERMAQLDKALKELEESDKNK